MAGWQQQAGAFGRVEAGLHPWPGVAAFGYGEASQAAGAAAGVGLRYEFGW